MILYLVPNKVIQGFIFGGADCNIFNYLCCLFQKNKQVVCILGNGMYFLVNWKYIGKEQDGKSFTAYRC